MNFPRALRQLAFGNGGGPARCRPAQWFPAAACKTALPFALGATLWGLGATLWGTAALADVEERLKHRWHAVEVIVFQRLKVQEETTAETLWRQGGRSYPRGFGALRGDVPGAGYRLAPFTRASLEFPTLSFTEPLRPPEGEPFKTEPASALEGDLAMDEQPLQPLPSEPATVAETQEDRPLPSEPAAIAEVQEGRSLPAEPAAVAEVQEGRPPPPIAPVIEPHPLLDLLGAVRQFENRLLAASYRLSGEGLKLGRAARRIDRDDDLELLWHGRWIQPVPPRNRPEPLLIQAGARRNGHYPLEGTMDVRAGGYLHFHAQLWFQDAEPDPAPSDLPAMAQARAADAVATASPGPRFMLLDESRAMRRGELHYLDHPKFGVLVRIDRVPPSRRLLEASATFEAAQGG